MTSCVARAVVAPKAVAKRSDAAKKVSKPSAALPAGAFAAASLAQPRCGHATPLQRDVHEGGGVDRQVLLWALRLFVANWLTRNRR